VEVAARKGNKELIQFLYIAIGSLSELETQYLIVVHNWDSLKMRKFLKFK